MAEPVSGSTGEDVATETSAQAASHTPGHSTGTAKAESGSAASRTELESAADEAASAATGEAPDTAEENSDAERAGTPDLERAGTPDLERAGTPDLERAGTPDPTEVQASEMADEAVPDQRGREDRTPEYVPDPAGTRPKVASKSLSARQPPPGAGGLDRTDGPDGPLLGQTFHPPLVASAGDGPRGDSAAAGPPAGARPDSPPESPHASRFQFILGALLALGLSAVALTAYTLGSGRDPVPADWSAWHPTTSGIGGAAQIANHVAAEYRLAGSGQLLAVKGGPLALAGVPVTIALKTSAAASGGVSVLGGNSVLYKMCGLGPGCSISGKASAERLMLVRREALELALYTFNYVDGADQVVVFLPPVLRQAPVSGHPKKVKVTTDPTDAVFFRAADLAGALSHPLGSTLTEQAPSLATVSGAPDTALVHALTSPSFYRFSFVQTSQDASLFLVLEPSAFGS